ncbi:MAG TPA: hypothetical protein VFB58_06210 [Chloroflexota bacterium]|nr:hypothetical protein [Chloroflexota bacterium]
MYQHDETLYMRAKQHQKELRQEVAEERQLRRAKRIEHEPVLAVTRRLLHLVAPRSAQ